MFLIEKRLEVFELAYIVFQVGPIILDLQRGIDIDILSFFHYLLISPDEFMKSEREIIVYIFNIIHPVHEGTGRV